MNANYDTMDLYTIANVNVERIRFQNESRWENKTVEIFVRRAQEAAYKAASQGDFSLDIFTRVRSSQTASPDERIVQQLESNPGVKVTFFRAPVSCEDFFKWVFCLDRKHSHVVYRLDWSSPTALEMQK